MNAFGTTVENLYLRHLENGCLPMFSSTGKKVGRVEMYNTTATTIQSARVMTPTY